MFLAWGASCIGKEDVEVLVEKRRDKACEMIRKWIIAVHKWRLKIEGVEEFLLFSQFQKWTKTH